MERLRRCLSGVDRAVPDRDLILAAAFAELQCLAHRRSLHFASVTAPHEPRGRELVWCVLEVLHATFAGERISHKDLVALADGVISAATISRAVDTAEQRGLLTKRHDPEDLRVVLLQATPEAVQRLLRIAPEEFARLDDAMARAQHRLLMVSHTE